MITCSLDLNGQHLTSLSTPIGVFLPSPATVATATSQARKWQKTAEHCHLVDTTLLLAPLAVVSDVCTNCCVMNGLRYFEMTVTSTTLPLFLASSVGSSDCIHSDRVE
jgi:hypothetical protein